MANELVFGWEHSGKESKTAATGIPYRVVVVNDGDVGGQVKPEQFSITVRCQVRYDDTWKWVRDMVGTSKASGSSLLRTLPEPCPYPLQDPADAAKKLPLVCVDLAWNRLFGNGFAADTTGPNYDKQFKGPQPHPDWNYWPYPGWTEWVATFAATPYKVLTDSEASGDESKRFTYTKTRYAAENEKVPGGSLKFVDGKATSLRETYARRSSITQVDQFFVNVPAVPDANIELVSGGVNKDVFQLGERKYPAECVQFDTFDKEPMFDSYGLPAWKYCYKFLCREDGRSWNTFWHPATGERVRCTLDGLASGAPAFRLVNLANLYKFA